MVPTLLLCAGPTVGSESGRSRSFFWIMNILTGKQFKQFCLTFSMEKERATDRTHHQETLSIFLLIPDSRAAPRGRAQTACGASVARHCIRPWRSRDSRAADRYPLLRSPPPRHHCCCPHLVGARPHSTSSPSKNSNENIQMKRVLDVSIVAL